MQLETQIQSLIVSLVYGLFTSLLYNIFYFLLYKDNKIISIISNLVFSITLSIAFFSIMYLINDAIIHPYFVILVILGFFLGNIKTKNIRIIVKNEERT